MNMGAESGFDALVLPWHWIRPRLVISAADDSSARSATTTAVPLAPPPGAAPRLATHISIGRPHGRGRRETALVVFTPICALASRRADDTPSGLPAAAP